MCRIADTINTGSFFDLHFHLLADTHPPIRAYQQILSIIERKDLADFAFTQLKGVKFIAIEIVEVEDTTVVFNKTHPLPCRSFFSTTQMKGIEAF